MEGSSQMNKRGRFSGMLVPIIVMGVIAVVLIIIGCQRGEGAHRFFSGASLS